MHFHFADFYHDTQSPLHRADARVKVVVAFALILLIGLTPFGAYTAYLAFFGLVMAGALIARIDPLWVISRSLIALPFTLAAASLIFTTPGEIIGMVPGVGWPITLPGLSHFASVILKSTVSTQVAVLLMFTTHFTDTLWALGKLRLPSLLIGIVSFMYRYLFVLADEALRLIRARDSRSAVIGGDVRFGQSLAFRARTAGGMIGNLLLRSIERSERIYLAMASRGYRGELRQMSPPPIPARDLLIGGVTLLIGVVILIASLMIL
jgi:cobalt/nickel transport system permease protein